MKAQFSIRRLLGVVMAVCVLLAAYQCAARAARKGQFGVYGCVLALVSAGLPAVLGAGAAGASGYSRAAMIGALVPALLAAVLFASALVPSQTGMGMPARDMWSVLAGTFYHRHALFLLWSLAPICGAAGIAAHWCLRG